MAGPGVVTIELAQPVVTSGLVISSGPAVADAGLR